MEIKIKAEHQAALTASAAHTGLTEDAYVQNIVDSRLAEVAAVIGSLKEKVVDDKYKAAIQAKGIDVVEAAIDAVTAASVEDVKP